MKPIIATTIACLTANTCVVLLRVIRTPEQPRYQLYSMDETSAANGKTAKSVYRVDTVSGRTWRISSSAFQTGALDAQHNPVLGWADAWEEISESSEAAVAKEQAGWQRTLDKARPTPTNPTPH